MKKKVIYIPNSTTKNKYLGMEFESETAEKKRKQSEKLRARNKK